MRKRGDWATRLRWTVSCCVFCAVAACGGERGTSATPDSDAPGPYAPDAFLAWAVEPVYTVGGIDAPDWAAFGDVAAVGFDGAGHLHLLDSQAKRLTVVGPDGELARVVGEPGEGPGELRYPSGMVVREDGTVSVLDVGHRAFVVYSADGALLRQVRLDPDGGLPEGALARLGDEIVGTRISVPFPSDEPLPSYRAVFAWSDREALPPRELHRAWRPTLPETTEPGPEITGGMRIGLPPVVAFHPDLMVAPLPGGGIAVVDSTTWLVHIVGEGGLESTIERPVEPAEATPAIREAERGLRLQTLRAAPPRMQISNSEGRSAAAPSEGVRRLQEARIAGMGFFPVVPVVERLAVDPEGRIWVQRSAGVPGVRGPTDLVTVDGEYLGSLPPDGVRIPDAFGPEGLVASISEDEWGVPVVRVGRLRR